MGIGSGSTIKYVVQAIAEVLRSRRGGGGDGGGGDGGVVSSNLNPATSGPPPSLLFIPTGYQSRQVIINAGLQPLAFDDLPRGQPLDVAFDGADEVDEELNCIKGGGACLFQEKLVVERARKFVCVAGESPPYPTRVALRQTYWGGKHSIRGRDLNWGLEELPTLPTYLHTYIPKYILNG